MYRFQIQNEKRFLGLQAWGVSYIAVHVNIRIDDGSVGSKARFEWVGLVRGLRSSEPEDHYMTLLHMRAYMLV